MLNRLQEKKLDYIFLNEGYEKYIKELEKIQNQDIKNINNYIDNHVQDNVHEVLKDLQLLF